MRFTTFLAPLAVAGVTLASEDVQVTTLTSTRTLTSTVTQCHSTNTQCTAGVNHNSTQVSISHTAPASQWSSHASQVTPVWNVANSTAAALPTGTAGFPGGPGPAGSAGFPGGVPPVVTGAAPSVVQGSGAAKGVVAMTGVVAAALAAAIAAF